MHLLVDGFGGDLKKMNDPDFIYRFLDSFPDSIGMHKIISPVIRLYQEGKEEDWGVSGFVMIAESHISIHTFPNRSYINIDIFSCKEFDAKDALVRLKDAFSLDQVKCWTLERGLAYSRPPRPLQAASQKIGDGHQA